MKTTKYEHQAGQTVIQNDIMSHPYLLNSVIARAVDGSKSKLEWYHKNYLDHVYAVSDNDGDILEHYCYTAFGEVSIFDANGNQVNVSQIDNQILWNTRRLDQVSGFYLYKYRHYASELGRWLSRDPIGENGGINLYGFASNDGINLWDVLGLDVDFFGRPIGDGSGYSGGNPYADRYRPNKPSAPTVSTQLGGYHPDVDLSDYFERRFPNKLEEQKQAAKKQIEKYISENLECETTLSWPPDSIVKPHVYTSQHRANHDNTPEAANEHPGDTPQSWWEAGRRLGRHVYSTKDIQIYGDGCCCFSYSATLYITDTPGVSSDDGTMGELLGSLFNVVTDSSPITIASWPIEDIYCIEQSSL